MKNKKILIPIIAGVALLAAVITVICIVVANKDEAYRIIKVYEIDGEAIVERDGKGEIEAYANMILESGDTVLLEEGTMTLKLDEDKYIYMEEGSEIVLRAKGTAKNSKTTITLKKGAITNELQNKLNDESSYELNTPNSTMSVRGTIYRAEVYESEDGNLHTRVSVFKGKVETQLVNEDGTKEKPVMITDKTEVIIYRDEDTTDYLTDVTPIDVSTLPPEAIKTIETIVNNGTKLDIEVDIPNETTTEDEGEKETVTKEDTDKDNSNTHTVTFMYEGELFGTQKVKDGECAMLPTLAPVKTGDWDFDFTKPITEDTVIEWK